jgi:hypothetical protein
MNDTVVAAQRRKRKEDGKRLKRQKIEESGGHRPRLTDANDTQATTTAASSGEVSSFRMSDGSQQLRHTKFYPKKAKVHRFGRVMEHAPCRNRPRYHTLSIAVPGSIISNCQTKELRTHMVGQIARAATIYHVDEIVVFDDKLSKSNLYEHRRRSTPQNREGSNDDQKREVQTEPTDGSTFTVKTDPHLFMARLLQYCECPQYLRRQFFPMHPDLQFSGLLPPLDAPHHVRANDTCKYREGVVLDKTGPNGTSLVNCGIPGRLVEYVHKT